jgi:hypothetical protein
MLGTSLPTFPYFLLIAQCLQIDAIASANVTEYPQDIWSKELAEKLKQHDSEIRGTLQDSAAHREQREDDGINKAFPII